MILGDFSSFGCSGELKRVGKKVARNGSRTVIVCLFAFPTLFSSPGQPQIPKIHIFFMNLTYDLHI